MKLRGLCGLLGPFPRGPGFLFDAVQLLEFHFTSHVEVPDHGRAPLLADAMDVSTDGALPDTDFLGDFGLREALQIEIGDLAAPFLQGELPAFLGGH